MHAARSISILAALVSLLLISGCDEQSTLTSSVQNEAGRRLERIGQGAGTVTERLRERRGSNRDRRRGRRLSRSGSDLLPHRGDYVIDVSGYSTATFAKARGTLTLELIDDCGDWTLQEKLDIRLTDQEDKIHRSNLLYRATEKASSNRFIFAYSREHLGERWDFIGDALPVDGGYVATFREPEIADLLLAADIMFPVGHFRQVVASARRQRDGFEASVFDGGNEIAYRAETRIGSPLRSNDSNPRVAKARSVLETKGSDRLPSGRAWPVTIDYFPWNDSFAGPVVTRQFMLHESGVIIGLHFDFGDLQMDASLTNLDIIEPVDCTTGSR